VNEPLRNRNPACLQFANMKTKTPTKKQAPTSMRPVIVCTEHRGVFYGLAKDTSGDVIHLKSARMAIYWGTTRGVMELSDTGPTPTSKISAPADIEVRKVTAVFEVSPVAAAAWAALK